MKLNKLMGLLPLTVLLAACGDKAPDGGVCLPADMVIHNTTIYNADDDNWIVEAMASKDDKIIFVGSNADVASYTCGNAEIFDMSGKYVYAGLTDGHQHLARMGAREMTVDLGGFYSLKETVSAIEAWADEVPDGGWVLGSGWIERDWSDDSRFLNKGDVDAFTENKPLYIPRSDNSSALVNSKALELLGVTKDTPDPFGGAFERYKDGEPTGYIVGEAMSLFEPLLPTGEDLVFLKDSIQKGMDLNVTNGWTAIHDSAEYDRDTKMIKELHAEGNLQHRIFASANIRFVDETLAAGIYDSGDDMYQLAGIKLYIDGTLGSRSAALLENYDDADHPGFISFEREDLYPTMVAALKAGFQVQTHAIGDKANRLILDWYEEAMNEVPKSEWGKADPRWRMEHAQLMDPADFSRFKELGILPSMQPSHAIGDLHYAEERIGLERLKGAYAWRTMIDAGNIVVGGTDAPAERGDPRIEFYAAVARKDTSGFRGEGWNLDLAVTREEALKMFTVWPAYGAFQENIKGMVKVGYLADFTVFDKDIMTIPESEILLVQNQMTIVGGKIVYQK
jgi:predicted amidohydrolase YtcJ